MIPFFSSFFVKSNSDEELYQITNKSGRDLTRLYVQFKFTDHVSAQSTLGYSMGMSIVNTVSVEKPLRNGETAIVRVNNLAQEIFNKKDVKIQELIGLLVSIDDAQFNNVESDNWTNQMTIGKAIETQSMHTRSKSYHLEARPSQ